MPLFCQKCSFIPLLHICQGPSVAASHQKRCPWPGAGQRCRTPRGTNQSPRQSCHFRTREPQRLPTNPAPRGSEPRPVRRRTSRLLARPRLTASPPCQRAAEDPARCGPRRALSARAAGRRRRRRRKHGGWEHVGGALWLCAGRARLPAPQHRLGHGEPRTGAGSGVTLEKDPRARARARGRRPGRRCPGPARGLPTPPPRRLCAVGAAFSRSRAAPEVPPVVSLFQS